MESSSKEAKDWTLHDVSEIIRKKFNDEIAEKFEGE